MKIRKSARGDQETLWSIFQRIIDRGDSFVWDSSLEQEDFNTLWLASDVKSYVLEDQGRVVGSYILKPNQKGRGSHIANGAYMVDQEYHGHGIGKLLCEHSIEEAKALGYKGIQFNIVVSTNEAAVKLWKKFGFRIIGTIPEGFNHKELGYMDAYIMYLGL